MVRLLSLVVLASLVFAQSSTAGINSSKIAAFSEIFAKDFNDKFYLCLLDAIQQGFPVQDAMEQCQADLDNASEIIPDVVGDALNKFGFGNSNVTSSRIKADCAGVDPSISNGQGAGGKAGSTTDGKDKKPETPEQKAAREELEKAKAAKEAAEKKEAETNRKETLAKATATAAAVAHQAATKVIDTVKDSSVGSDPETAAKLDRAQKDANEALGKALDLQGDAYVDHANAEEDLERANIRLDDAQRNYDRLRDKRNHTAADSQCEETMAEAREVLHLCAIAKWKPDKCSILRKSCASDLILVDPDQGFTCAPTYDPESVRAAFVKHCEKNTTPGPDGRNPCEKIVVEQGGFIVHWIKNHDFCSPENSNPIAYVDVGNTNCFIRVEGKIVNPAGGPSIEDIIALGFKLIGGPIIVLPKSGPSPIPPKG